MLEVLIYLPDNLRNRNETTTCWNILPIVDKVSSEAGQCHEVHLNCLPAIFT